MKLNNKCKNCTSSNQSIYKSTLTIMNKKSKDFQCPYKDISCDKVDTAGMDKKVPCTECNHYLKVIPFEKKPSKNK